MTVISAKAIACDLAGLAGVGLVVYGVWLMYRPAGYVVAGVMLLTGVWFASRAEA